MVKTIATDIDALEAVALMLRRYALVIPAANEDQLLLAAAHSLQRTAGELRRQRPRRPPPGFLDMKV